MLASVLKSAIGVVVTAFILSQAVMFYLSHAPRKAPEPPAAAGQARGRPSASYIAPASAGFAGEATIGADRLGQYSTEVEIEGARVHMLVDTGASSVVLSYEDAAAAGFYPGPSDFKFAAQTANGVSKMARVRLRQIRLGAILLRDVDAYVADRGALGASLLGMSFLSRLSHFEAASGRMILRQ
jgi:aspartyl protease family protein